MMLEILNGLLITAITGLGYYAWLLWDEKETLKIDVLRLKAAALDLDLDNMTMRKKLEKIEELSKV